MGELADQSFDAVLDKAAMDALMVQEGDVWNPRQTVIDQARSMCQHISRIIKRNGKFLQISFSQPHFRKKYLLGLHPVNGSGDDTEQLDHSSSGENESVEFQWTLRVATIAEKGCFENFLYIMERIP